MGIAGVKTRSSRLLAAALLINKPRSNSSRSTWSDRNSYHPYPYADWNDRRRARLGILRRLFDRFAQVHRINAHAARQAGHQIAASDFAGKFFFERIRRTDFPLSFKTA